MSALDNRGEIYHGPTVKFPQNVFKSGIVGRVVKKGEPPHSAIEHMISQAASGQSWTRWQNSLDANSFWSVKKQLQTSFPCAPIFPIRTLTCCSLAKPKHYGLHLPETRESVHLGRLQTLLNYDLPRRNRMPIDVESHSARHQRPGR
jgi:hypothetical protein